MDKTWTYIPNEVLFYYSFPAFGFGTSGLIDCELLV